MATVSAKKGKKVKKNNKLSLGEFLTDGNTAVLNQVQVAVPVKLDWCDDVDDDDDDRVVRTQVIALPTAPRASRIMNDDSIPQNPPFSIYVSNLPYDINEDDLYDIFEKVEIVSMSLPRDDGDSRRLRGFGTIEFATRNDLLEVLAMPEPMVRNRRIRIGLFNENDTKRRNNRYDNFTGDSDRASSGGNWRDRPDSGPRPMDRDRDGGGMRRPYNSNYNRDDRDRPSGESGGGGGGGNWRTGDRPSTQPPLSPNASRRYDRDRDGGGGMRRGPPDGRPPSARREPDVPMERPKLVMQPRTLPLPEPQKARASTDSDDEPERNDAHDDGGEPVVAEEPRPRPTPVPAAKVFGDAKPVDTAAREREIEERLLQKREEERLRKREQAEAAAAAAAATAAEAAAEEQQQDGRSDAEKENMDTADGGSRSANEPITNWRVRTINSKDDQGKTADERPVSPSRRYSSPIGKYNSNRRPTDDRRGMNRSTYSNGTTGRDQDRTDRGGRDTRAFTPRDGTATRNGDTKDRRDAPKPLDNEKEREPKVSEERMPKFQEPTGPNLSMKNTFEGLSSEEIDD